MNSEALFALLGDIDDNYITAAAQPAKKIIPWRIIAPVAVCAVLAILAVTLLRTAKPAPLHSYTVGEAGAVLTMDTAAGGGAGDTGQQYTGEIIGGALAPDPDVPAQQEAIDAYQHLLAHFDAEYGPGNYPDWYGGAYIVNGNYLIVNLVNSFDETLADKNFYFEIMDWCGSTSVGFGGSKYALNELLALQKQVTALPELAGLGSWGCGVDEMRGVVTLDVPSADKALLAALAKLDPDDDAIVVNVGEIISTDTAAD